MIYAARTAPGTGLPASDALSAARMLQAVADPVLFKAGTCIEDVDRAGPMITFELPAPAVTDVRGTIMVRARATDLLDDQPTLTLSLGGSPLADDDGNPGNDLATVTIDTAAISAATLTVTARAVDDATNETLAMKTWAIDNAAPVVTVAADDFFDDGTAWWIRPVGMPATVPTGPRLSGTVDDAHLLDLRALVAGSGLTS